jgi:hypothetical protein
MIGPAVEHVMSHRDAQSYGTEQSNRLLEEDPEQVERQWSEPQSVRITMSQHPFVTRFKTFLAY